MDFRISMESHILEIEYYHLLIQVKTEILLQVQLSHGCNGNLFQMNKEGQLRSLVPRPPLPQAAEYLFGWAPNHFQP